MKTLLKRYRIFLIMVAIYFGLFFIRPTIFQTSVTLTWKSMAEMLTVLPPIFILLGLLDIWVKKETMVKYMGEGSGWIGIVLAFFLGSAAAGPLYAAFPVAVTLLKKGSSLTNVLILIGAWSTTKIPLLLFEASSMGLQFTLLRFGLDLIGIAVIAILSNRLLNAKDKEEIQHRVELNG
jgi:uncharacterized membrane protein YraQ (UPF0718 family)